MPPAKRRRVDAPVQLSTQPSLITLPARAQGRRESSSSSSSSATGGAASTIFSPLKHQFFIIAAKFSSEDIVALHQSVERSGGRITGDLVAATIIITRLSAADRLSRYLTRENKSAWEGKPVVKESYVNACVRLGTVQDSGTWRVKAADELLRRYDGEQPSSLDDGPTTNEPSSAVNKSAVCADMVQRPDLPSDVDAFPVTRMDKKDWTNSVYAVHHRAPLYCENERLVRELAVIRTQRQLEGDERSMLSYMRAIAAIKALPFKIRSQDDVKDVKMIGPKIRALVGEFLRNGKLGEAERHRHSERYKVLTMLARTIHGVGPAKARELYAEPYNVRSVDDLRRLNVEGVTQVGLKHWEDLQLKIPRPEVEKIAKTIMVHVESLVPGCLHTICGGYRRGKSESNDVDIVMTHPDPNANRWRGLLSKLVQRLTDKGLVSDVLYYTTPESDENFGLEVHRHATQLDRLDKAFVVFKQPASPPERPRPVHRRVDLIVSPARHYGTAIVGWTGSTMFERDIRRYSDKECGIRFDSGGLVTREGKEIPAFTEEEVFEKLSLSWIPPEYRNADVAG